MLVEVREVAGLCPAMEAMRYSFDSQPDGTKGLIFHDGKDPCHLWRDDYDLLQRLIVAGDSHAKVCRMIQVWARIEAPRYWWAEMDTYHVGMTEMSESTVHTIKRDLKNDAFGLKNFEITDFSKPMVEAWITKMKGLAYRGELDNLPVEEIKQTIPESFIQGRMVNLNYQTLRHIYFDRRNHRMRIWHTFLDTLLGQLPFPGLITVEKGDK